MVRRAPRAQQERLQAALRSLRTDAGLTQVELAEMLRRPQSFVSKYESGERRLDILELKEICEVLGLTLVSFTRRLERTIR